MIGRRLKELRQRLRLAQIDMGEVMGYGQPMVSQIESGEKRPSTESLLKVATEFRISLDWLLGTVKEVDMADYRREITPEEDEENLRLIKSEPLLSLRIKHGNLDKYDRADIANYIRKVRDREAREAPDSDTDS